MLCDDSERLSANAMPSVIARGAFTWISEWGVRCTCRLGTEWALRLGIGPELRNLGKEHRTLVRRRWADWETPWMWLVGDARQGAAHGRHRCFGHRVPWRLGWDRLHCRQRIRQKSLAVRESVNTFYGVEKWSSLWWSSKWLGIRTMPKIC